MSEIVRRVALIRARVEHEHGPVERCLFVTVICNRCGRTRTVDSPDPDFIERHFAGWHLTRDPEDADLCPACAQ